jgi:hypothetical protein
VQNFPAERSKWNKAWYLGYQGIWSVSCVAASGDSSTGEADMDRDAISCRLLPERCEAPARLSCSQLRVEHAFPCWDSRAVRDAARPVRGCPLRTMHYTDGMKACPDVDSQNPSGPLRFCMGTPICPALVVPANICWLVS